MFIWLPREALSLCGCVVVCLICLRVRPGTTPPWPTRDNGADNFSADRAKRPFLWRSVWSAAQTNPSERKQAPCLSPASCFNNSHCLWKCSRPLNTHRHGQGRNPRANYFFFLVWKCELEARRRGRKGCLARSQTSQQGRWEYWSPLMAAECYWKKVFTPRSMPTV